LTKLCRLKLEGPVPGNYASPCRTVPEAQNMAALVYCMPSAL